MIKTKILGLIEVSQTSPHTSSISSNSFTFSLKGFGCLDALEHEFDSLPIKPLTTVNNKSILKDFILCQTPI